MLDYRNNRLLLALVAFVIIAYGGIGENLVYYWSPTQVKDAGPQAMGTTIRLGGLVQEGSVHFDEATKQLSFTVVDEQNSIVVRSQGVPLTAIV